MYSKYKIEFNKYEPRIDEATGNIWRAGTTSILIYKCVQNKFLWWRWYAWKMIAYYSYGGLLNYETNYFTTVESMRHLLYNEIGLTENDRLTH
jgi:hypothetical protein